MKQADSKLPPSEGLDTPRRATERFARAVDVDELPAWAPKHHESRARLHLCSDTAHVHCITCGCPLAVLSGERTARRQRPYCVRCHESGADAADALPSLDDVASRSRGWDTNEAGASVIGAQPRRSRAGQSGAKRKRRSRAEEGRSRSATHCPHGVPFARPCRGCARTAASPSDVEARHDARERV